MFSDRIAVAPSVLSCDFCNIEAEMNDIKECGADLLHLDVMDGIFVPNITFGMPVIAAMRKKSDMYFDTHLMIEKPERYIDEFVKAGSSNITIHVEACEDVIKTVEHIKSCGVEASISVKPKTPVEAIYDYLPFVDNVLVMTVEPGFGGQSFMNDMIPKIEKLVKYRSEHGKYFGIEVDGGINSATAKLVKEAGANILVAGSFVFKAQNRKLAIEELRG